MCAGWRVESRAREGLVSLKDGHRGRAAWGPERLVWPLATGEEYLVAAVHLWPSDGLGAGHGRSALRHPGKPTRPDPRRKKAERAGRAGGGWSQGYGGASDAVPAFAQAFCPSQARPSTSCTCCHGPATPRAARRAHVIAAPTSSRGTEARGAPTLGGDVSTHFRRTNPDRTLPHPVARVLRRLPASKPPLFPMEHSATQVNGRDLPLRLAEAVR